MTGGRARALAASRRAGALSVLVLALALSVHGAARAQQRSIVEEGRALYESGDLGGALDLLTTAEARDDLTRDDLIRVLETRVLIHHVQSDGDALITDLRALVALAPGRPASAEFPPEVRDQMTRLRADIGGPVRVRSEVGRSGSSVTARAEIVADPGRLSRVARIHVRSAGERTFRSSDRAITLRGIEGALEHFAEAVGPGGVVLATDGSRDAPLTFEIPSTNDPVRTGGSSPWPWIGAGIGLVVAAVVVGVLVVASSDSATQSRVSGPVEAPDMP